MKCRNRPNNWRQRQCGVEQHCSVGWKAQRIHGLLFDPLQPRSKSRERLGQSVGSEGGRRVGAAAWLGGKGWQQQQEEGESWQWSCLGQRCWSP